MGIVVSAIVFVSADLPPITLVLDVLGGKLGRSSGFWPGTCPLLPLTPADETRWKEDESGENWLVAPSFAAMVMSADVGVLPLVVSEEADGPPAPPLNGPSLRRRACVAGESGAVRWDLRFDLCIISTAHASRSTGVRLAACMKGSWSYTMGQQFPA
jgi:hypothetical protein